MSWIQTYTNTQFWPLAPVPEDVQIEDIAQPLSLKCRFNGHCREFYCVAQHSVLVARTLLKCGVLHKAGPSRTKNAFRLALLHDAGEAYLPDVCRPIKPSWPDFDKIEQQLLRCIHFALGVRSEAELEVTIKHCDGTLLATEARDLMGPPPAQWDPLPLPLEDKIVPWPPRQAKRIWLQEWHAHG